MRTEGAGEVERWSCGAKEKRICVCGGERGKGAAGCSGVEGCDACMETGEEVDVVRKSLATVVERERRSAGEERQECRDM